MPKYICLTFLLLVVLSSGGCDLLEEMPQDIPDAETTQTLPPPPLADATSQEGGRDMDTFSRAGEMTQDMAGAGEGVEPPGRSVLPPASLVFKGEDADAPLPYYEYLPASYFQGDQPPPVLLILHDASRDEELHTLPVLAAIEQGGWNTKSPLVVIAPQFPQIKNCRDTELLESMLDYVFSLYTLDTKRIYLMGDGCGGEMALEYAKWPRGERTPAALITVGPMLLPHWREAGCGLRNAALHAFVDDTGDSSSRTTEIHVAGALDRSCTEIRPQEAVVTLYDDDLGRQNALSINKMEWLLSKTQHVPPLPLPLGPKGRVLVDFGQQNQASAAPWNNIFSARYGAADEVFDQDARRTSVFVRIWNPFLGELPSGPTKVTGLPRTASGDMVLTGGTLGQMPAQASKVVVGGLDRSMTYTVRLFAGRLSDDQHISLRGRYTLNRTTTRVFDSRQNHNAFLEFKKVNTSEDGTLVLEVQAETRDIDPGIIQGAYADLNAIELIAE